jgi:hypothetical protein
MSENPEDWEPDEQAARSELADQLEAIRRRHAADPPLDLLMAARAELLPAQIQQHVAHHLEHSAWSRALVAGVEEATGTQAIDPHSEQRMWRRVQELTKSEPAARVSRALPPWLYGATALAASIVVAIVIGRAGSAPAPVESAPPAPPRAALAPPRAAVAEPPKAAEPLAFSKPAVKLSAAALTWRSGAGVGTFQHDLKPALEAYRQGDYAAADALFTSLGQSYPRAVEVSFYGGVSRMMRGDFTGAISPLAKALDLNEAAFAEDIAWYLAVAEQRAGREADALKRLTGLCAAAGPLAPQACAAENSLRERRSSARP